MAGGIKVEQESQIHTWIEREDENHVSKILGYSILNQQKNSKFTAHF